MKLNLYLTQEKELKIQQDLILRAKNTNIINCYIYDEDDFYVNITGMTVYFMVKEQPSDDDDNAKIDIEITDFSDSQNGQVDIELSDTDTEDLEGNYVYEIKIKDTENKIYTIAEGNICFQRSISGI